MRNMCRDVFLIVLPLPLGLSGHSTRFNLIAYNARRSERTWYNFSIIMENPQASQACRCPVRPLGCVGNYKHGRWSVYALQSGERRANRPVA